MESPLEMKMSWIEPAKNPPIPTFSIMNADGLIEDESRLSPELTPDKMLGLYKNMLTGN